MIRALELIRSRVKDELGIDPQLEGVRRFALYGGIELPFVEYSISEPSGKLRLAFEAEDTAWLIIYLDGDRVFTSELDTLESTDEAVMLLRAALQGGVRFRRSAFHRRGGATIKGEEVNWYMEPFVGELAE